MIIICATGKQVNRAGDSPTRAAEMDQTESGPYESNVTESVTSSSSSTLIPTVPPPTPYERRNTFRIGSRWEVSLFWTNVFFAFVVVAGQTGEDISFPLWINSTAKGGNSSAPTSGSYFVLSFASLSFVVIFGLGTLFIRIFSPRDLGATERSFPHFLLFLVGLCNALNGVLTTVLARKSEGTSPHLQAILGTFTIPLTISARLVNFLLLGSSEMAKLRQF